MFVQKANISFTIFQQEPADAPMFQSIVWVDNICLTSHTIFSHMNDAKEDDSRLYLEAPHARSYAQQDVLRIRDDLGSLV